MLQQILNQISEPIPVNKLLTDPCSIRRKPSYIKGDVVHLLHPPDRLRISRVPTFRISQQLLDALFCLLIHRTAQHGSKKVTLRLIVLAHGEEHHRHTIQQHMML